MVILEPWKREVFAMGCSSIGKTTVCIGICLVLSACLDSRNDEPCTLVSPWNCDDNILDIESSNKASFRMLQLSTLSQRGSEGGISLRVSSTRGDINKTVPGGREIHIEDVVIRGADSVDGEVELVYGALTVGGRTRPQENSKTGYIAHFGLAHSEIDLTLFHNGSVYKAGGSSTELYGQVGFFVRPLPSIDIDITYSYSLGKSLNSTREIDLLFNYHLIKHLKVFGGYRNLKHEYDVNNTHDRSGIMVNHKGPVLGIHVLF